MTRFGQAFASPHSASNSLVALETQRAENKHVTHTDRPLISCWLVQRSHPELTDHLGKQARPACSLGNKLGELMASINQQLFNLGSR